MIFCDCGSRGFSQYSFMIILECSIHSFQASLQTLSKMRCPTAPFQGMRSRPSISLPNLTHITLREPGRAGVASTGFGGLQESSAKTASACRNVLLLNHTALRRKFLGGDGAGARRDA